MSHVDTPHKISFQRSGRKREAILGKFKIKDLGYWMGKINYITKFKKLKKIRKISIYLSMFLVAMTIISVFFIDVKIVAIILFSLIALKSYLIHGAWRGKAFIVAFPIALALTLYYPYEYTTLNLMIWKINLFPLVCWTCGLMLTKKVYEELKIPYRFIKISLIYVLLLIVFEYISYHFFGVKLNSNFPSLWGLGSMHAPLNMKIIYLLLGPVYILIMDYLKW